jgi:phosphatidylserine decarboxylase
MIISYGIKFIIYGLLLIIALVLWGAVKDSVYAFSLAGFFALITLFLTFFYRNPTRQIPKDNSLILSIADGKVLSVEDIENDYIGGMGKKVSIFLSIFNVHVNRMPVTGTVEYIKYNPGKFEVAYSDKASEVNESNEIGMVFIGGKLIFKQIAGAMARRIESKAKSAENYKAGDIYGMIHFGSRAELFLPENIEILVKKGDKVSAGITAIGRIRK